MAGALSRTADGRYIIVNGRLWRATNPRLSKKRVAELQSELMDARRAVRSALKSGNQKALSAARHGVNKAKIALGERGSVWWKDGARDYNRFLVRNTPYAEEGGEDTTES